MHVGNLVTTLSQPCHILATTLSQPCYNPLTTLSQPCNFYMSILVWTFKSLPNQREHVYGVNLHNALVHIHSIFLCQTCMYQIIAKSTCVVVVYIYQKCNKHIMSPAPAYDSDAIDQSLWYFTGRWPAFPTLHLKDTSTSQAGLTSQCIYKPRTSHCLYRPNT